MRSALAPLSCLAALACAPPALDASDAGPGLERDARPAVAEDAAVSAPPDAAAPADAGPPSAAGLELGGGVDGYEPRPDGGDVVVHPGPQGGYHVFVSLRRAPPLDTPLDLTLEVYDDVARRISHVRLMRRLDRSADGAASELPGIPLVLEIPGLERVEGTMLEVRARIAAGALVESQRRTWRAVAPP